MPLWTPLNSPQSRPPPEGPNTRSSGPAESPCELCSPPARPARSVLPDPVEHMKEMDDTSTLMLEGWCSPTLVSPAGRPRSVMDLAVHQASGPVDIANPFLDDEQWDMEAMVLSTIVGQQEDEDDEEETACSSWTICDDEDVCLAADASVGPFTGWARPKGESSCYGGSSCELDCFAHASTPPVKTSTAELKSSGASMLPSHGTAENRQEAHWKMASKDAHAAFVCGCHLAMTRGASSCLDRFGKEHFRRWHKETYGVTADGIASTQDAYTAIHHKMLALKEPIVFKDEKECDAHGRKWKIKTWKLDDQEVAYDLNCTQAVSLP